MANTIQPTPGVQTTPHPELATSANFMNYFDYAMVYEPDAMVDIYPRYGNGKLFSFTKFMGRDIPFASDIVMWQEQGRLHQLVEDVTITGDVFDCGSTKHNLRINDIIWISDGTDQEQADVYEVVDENTFKAHRRTGTGAFPFDTTTTTVNLFVGSNEWGKKTENFTQGRTEKPEFKENYPQILKEFYDAAKSDLAQLTWVTPPSGGKDKWFVYEWERTRIRFENLKEVTNLFGTRAVAGSNAAIAGKKGMDGAIPQIQAGGNVGNGYITDITDVDDWTKRLRKQGNVNTFTLWNDQQQMIHYNTLLASQNSYWDGGTNYGMFQNSPGDDGKGLSLHLDFQAFTRNGYHMFVSRLDVLDEPTMFGGNKFIDTGIGSLMVPGSEKIVTEKGESVARPYMVTRHRKSGEIDRTCETKILGLDANPTRRDALEIHYTSEFTNQIIGSNEWGFNNR
jgi:hypothetical protein